MAQYTVTTVGDQTRPWGDGMLSYRATLKAPDGVETPNVDIARKASAAPPKPGDVVDGTIDMSGQYGPKFKADRKGGFGGGRGKDPQERAEIRRQNAQAQALRYMEIKGVKDFKPADLKPVIDWFFNDTGSVKA